MNRLNSTFVDGQMSLETLWRLLEEQRRQNGSSVASVVGLDEAKLLVENNRANKNGMTTLGKKTLILIRLLDSSWVSNVMLIEWYCNVFLDVTNLWTFQSFRNKGLEKHWLFIKEKNIRLKPIKISKLYFLVVNHSIMNKYKMNIYCIQTWQLKQLQYL